MVKKDKSSITNFKTMSEQTTPSKKISVGLILSWIFGVLFALTGIVFVFSEPIPGLVMLVMAAVLLPLSKGMKIVVIIIGFIIFGATIDTSKTENQQNNQSQVQQEQLVLNTEQNKYEVKLTEEQPKTVNNEKPVKTEKTEIIPTPDEKPDERAKEIQEAWDALVSRADTYRLAIKEMRKTKTETIKQATILEAWKDALEDALISCADTYRFAIEEMRKTKTETIKQATIPAEYKSALNKATAYANIMNMSKQGVYDQLVSEYGEKFSAAAAQYAIDNVKADWNANALAKAKAYQNIMNMSPAAIHDQLTSKYGEKFTKAEADYAIRYLND